MDELDDALQPHCPQCGTVLRDIVGGYRCDFCGLIYLPRAIASE